MRGKLAGLCIGGALLCAPLFVLASTNTVAPFRYNRISADFEIQKNGDVTVTEPITMLFNDTYNSLWVGIPASTTVVSDVVVYDGSTGQQMTYSAKSLKESDPDSWGKYTFSNATTSMRVEWYFNTSDRVHTWVLKYTLHNAVTFYPDHDEFSWDVSTGFSEPLDTVEATVHLPGAVTEPHSSLFTTNEEDYYIDRPDDRTFRYRVSGMYPNERVNIQAGWQKGLIAPRVPLPKRLAIYNFIHTYMYWIVALIVAVIGALLYIAKRWYTKSA